MLFRRKPNCNQIFDTCRTQAACERSVNSTICAHRNRFSVSPALRSVPAQWTPCSALPSRFNCFLWPPLTAQV